MGIYILAGFKKGKPKLRRLTKDFPEGNFVRPELSYDGTKVLFAFAKYYPHVCHVEDKTRREENLPEDSFYHLYEMNVDGSGVRQLTHGYYNDFDGRYLPDGRIVFLSTRKGTAIQAGYASAQKTCDATQPESFVRCGGGNTRPVAVYTLHRMNADGSDLCAISAFENFEWTPSIAHDGRILYARWDYIDRFNGHFMSLWSTNPDGTYPNLVYGNYTKRPQCVFEARPIPGSRKLIFTATAHHSITGGSLALLDRSKGSEFEHPLTRLTPEVCFPETEGFPDHYYSGPWPLDETHYLCAWHDRKLPPHRCMTGKEPENPGNAGGIYLYDAFGNLNLLYRDPEITSQNPIPLRPRTVPRALPDLVDRRSPQRGRFLLQDVYRGMEGIERGTINGNTVDGNAVRRIRVVGVLPKVQPQYEHAGFGRLARGYRQGRSRHGAGSRGRLGLVRDSLRHPRLFPGPGRRRAVNSHDAVVDLRPARPDARLRRMPRIARFGPGPTVTCRWHSAENPIHSSPTRKAPGRCATTGSSSRCWTAIAPDATP